MERVKVRVSEREDFDGHTVDGRQALARARHKLAYEATVIDGVPSVDPLEAALASPVKTRTSLEAGGGLRRWEFIFIVNRMSS